MDDRVGSDKKSVTLTAISDDSDWADIFAEWCSFVDGEDARVGFWCDPRVMRSESTSESEPLLIAEVRHAQKLVALVPFKKPKKRVPFRIGLATIGSIRATQLVLYDAPFPITSSLDRLVILKQVIDVLRLGEHGDVVIIPEWELSPDGANPFPSGVERSRQPSYRMTLPKSAKEYVGGFSSSARGKLRGKQRKLEKSLGKVDLRCFREPADVPEYHAHAKAVWTKSWHVRFSDALPDQELLKQIAEHGWLRGYVLFGPNDIPVAIAVGFQYRGTYLYYRTAYDPAYHHLSPGTVLAFLLLQDLADHDSPTEFDFGFGENQCKSTLCKRAVDQVETWIAISVRGSILVKGLSLFDSVYSVGKRLLANTSAVRWLKGRVREIRQDESPRTETADN